MNYARTAIAYENDATFVSTNGPHHFYSTAEIARWRAWTCWSAAIKQGLVLA